MISPATTLVIGTSAVDMVRGGPTSLMGVTVADAMREYFDADFSFQNNGGAAARMLITCAPAGIEGFFRAAHQIDSPATLTEIAAERNSTLIFPLPVELLKAFIK